MDILLRILYIIAGLCIDMIILLFCLIIMISVISYWKDIQVGSKIYKRLTWICFIFLIIVTTVVDYIIGLPGHRLFIFLNSIH